MSDVRTGVVSSDGAGNGLVYAAVERAVLTRPEAVDYLHLTNDASLQRLIERGEITPLTFVRPFVLLRSELDDFLRRQLDAEKKRRSVPR